MARYRELAVGGRTPQPNEGIFAPGCVGCAWLAACSRVDKPSENGRFRPVLPCRQWLLRPLAALVALTLVWASATRSDDGFCDQGFSVAKVRQAEVFLATPESGAKAPASVEYQKVRAPQLLCESTEAVCPVGFRYEVARLLPRRAVPRATWLETIELRI